MKRTALLALWLACSPAAMADWLALQNGHAKGQYQLTTFPDDSVLREAIGATANDASGELRLVAGGRGGQWSWSADYQVLLRHGDTVRLANRFDGGGLLPDVVPEDDRRLMDLTHVISRRDDRLLAHRLDRLQLGYTSEKTVLRLGRQAVSWGNGLLYNPVDFFNPFDPAAVDKEYKSGDDMLYGQYLLDSGDDWQYVHVWRRDADGHTDSDVNTHALKYHAFIGERELDLLLARHYDDDVLSVGGISNLGGAIVRGDLLYTGTEQDSFWSAVGSLSYSWTWGGRNVSGVTEYFFNGIGLRQEDYANLAAQPDLLSRLQRAELFSLGRHYLAAGLTMEMTPLLLLQQGLFLNLGDSSGLLQLVAQYDMRQSLQLLLAVNLPFGASGTEYGGVPLPGTERYLGTGPGLFSQIAFYF